MKLSRKADYQVQYKPQEKEKESGYKQAPPLDWSKYVIDWEAIVPHGKYKGSTLEDVKYEDDWYWNWIQENDIINQWGMYLPKDQVHKKKVKSFWSDTDKRYWIGIICYEISTDPVPNSWLYE